jgi:isoquinoline 1-oxidoreductase beta subunit
MKNRKVPTSLKEKNQNLAVNEELGIDIGKNENDLNRRDFLKLSTLAGAGLMLSINFFDSKIAKASVDAPASFEPNVYLKIGSDGKIIIMAKNPEIGQGVKTSMPQIIAEELEVEWNTIEVQQGMLDNRFGAQFAGGSTGIKTNFDTLRKAGATAREMLIEAASRRWNISLDKCYAENGFVIRKGTGDKLSYGELAEAASKLNVRENPPLKDKKDYKIIGKAIGGVDNPLIVTGKAEFGLDAKPKGLVVACIERCPVYGGKVKSVDDSAALKVDGVLQVIKIEPTSNPTQIVAGIAVIAKNTWAAMKGRKALKIEWDYSGGETENDSNLKSQFEKNINSKTDPLRNDGNVDEAFANAKKVHEGIFEAPFLAHAPMEPMNYIADVRADGADLWGPTQVPGAVRARAAEITGLAPDKIKVRMTRVGGGFGRRLMADYACEAIYVSKTIGKPVQVVWTREDDIQHDFYRPAGMYKIKAALDDSNKLIAWHITSSTTSRGMFSGSTNPAHQTEVFPDGFPAGFVPNFRMEYVPVVSKVPRGAWRAPGHNVTAWIDQTFIDEMAVLAGKNPVDFRLELLGEEDKMMPYRDHGGPVYSTRRLKNVIRLAAEKSNWYQPLPKGTYRGFAAHFMFGAYVAEVVHISMTDPNTIKLERAYAVVDCGLVINKSGALNQLEGGIIDGLSATLNQAIHIENGRAKEGNFDDYKLMRMKDAPKVEVHLVESDEPPEGLGEMTLPPIAAALSNAVFAATGKRIRKLPINLSDKANI